MSASNTERFNHCLVGFIHEFFQNGRYMPWRFVGPALMEYNLGRFDDATLERGFLKLFFKNDKRLAALIPNMQYRHHQLIITLMKEVCHINALNYRCIV